MEQELKPYNNQYPEFDHYETMSSYYNSHPITTNFKPESDYETISSFNFSAQSPNYGQDVSTYSPAINSSSTPKGLNSSYSTNCYTNYYQTYYNDVNNYTDSAYQTLDYSNQQNPASSIQRQELDGSYQKEESSFDSRKRKEPCDVGPCLDVLSEILNDNSSTKRKSKRSKLEKIDKTEFKSPDENFCNYNCSICLQAFSSLAKYLMHKHKVHSNGPSTECPVCFKRFGSQANTLVHMRAHTQEKTYQCRYCEQSFCDSSTLKKHLRTHTGERPYECEICQRRFSQSGNLKRHLEVHKKYDNTDDHIPLVSGDLDFQVDSSPNNQSNEPPTNFYSSIECGQEINSIYTHQDEFMFNLINDPSSYKNNYLY